MNITHNAWNNLFLLSGEVQEGDDEQETDFTSQIGEFNGRLLQFVYENFDGERGVCRGVTPTVGANKFTVHYVDLIGFDQDSNANTQLVFQRE